MTLQVISPSSNMHQLSNISLLWVEGRLSLQNSIAILAFTAQSHRQGELDSMRKDVIQMSTETQVTYRGFLLRLRKLAKIALESYGLESKSLKFITNSGNGLYQVSVQENDSSPNYIEPGRYTLRLHQHGYMKPEYIASEMEWLSALSKEGISVPKPIRNLNGDWLSVADGNYDVPAKRWKKPKGFARPHWDWEGLFGEGFDYGFSASEARKAIPKEHQSAFNDVLDQVTDFSKSHGKGKKVYGLIHADLGVMDNASYFEGEIHPFDFDDCGFGYWIFDLGVVLAHYMLDSNVKINTMRNALIAGYEESSMLALDTLEYLDLFIKARLAQLMFFYQGHAVRDPVHLEQALGEINSCAKVLKHILKKQG